MAPSELVRSGLRRLRDLVRRLIPQKPPKDEEQRRAAIADREFDTTATQEAHATNSVRVREEDAKRRANHGLNYAERRELALRKAREALAEIEELL
jgi:hypothetical protein